MIREVFIMIKKLIICVLCMCMLSACTLSLNKPETLTDNTNSNIDGTTEATTVPPAEAVADMNSLSSKKIVWGPGNIENHQQPNEPKGLDEKYAELSALWFASDKKEILLTFDEGYENGFTPSILDTLKEKNVKAVFFVTYDFAKDNNDLIRRMIDEGHIVGNHSYHHYSMDELDNETAEEEVMFLHRYIKDNFNYTMSYFRFPKGEFSEQNLALLKRLGYTSVFWSFAYADWDVNAQPDESAAFTKICESTHPGEIMLLHAVSKTNADILPKVIDDIRQQGYEFKSDF